MMPGDRSDYLETPNVLDKDTYPLVARRILGDPLPPNGEWEQPAGSCVFYGSGEVSDTLTPAHSLSLRQQLHQVVTWPGALHPDLDNKPPEAYVFVRPEGVALRHTLDGFYNGLYGGRLRRSGPKRPPLTLVPVDVLSYRPDAIEDETNRLRDVIGNLGHVCLIDNNATLHNSASLQLVASMAYNAGAQEVSALRTVLFKNIDPRHINLKKMEVSTHARFLKRLGKLCCDLTTRAANSY